MCVGRLGKQISAVTAEDRERTKHVVYAVIYGVGTHVRSAASTAFAPGSPARTTVHVALLQGRRDWGKS